MAYEFIALCVIIGCLIIYFAFFAKDVKEDKELW